MNAHAERQSDPAAVFIIGAPRTGSTILFQILTNALRVTYPDNLTQKFGDHLRCGLRVSRILFGDTTHDCFTSIRGRTNHCGLHAPNEMEHFFKRLFPSVRAASEVAAAASLAKLLQPIVRTYERPIVFKSLRIGQRIGLLAGTMPFARFIHIKRDPLFTAQSIILARAAEGKAPDTVWYVVPRQSERLAEIQGVRKVVRQIHLIDEEIDEELSRLPGVGATIHYRDLCCDPTVVIDRLSTFLGAIPPRPRHRSPALAYSETQMLDRVTFNELRRAVDELEWR